MEAEDVRPVVVTSRIHVTALHGDGAQVEVCDQGFLTSRPRASDHGPSGARKTCRPLPATGRSSRGTAGASRRSRAGKRTGTWSACRTGLTPTTNIRFSRARWRIVAIQPSPGRGRGRPIPRCPGRKVRTGPAACSSPSRSARRPGQSVSSTRRRMSPMPHTVRSAPSARVSCAARPAPRPGRSTAPCCLSWPRAVRARPRGPRATPVPGRDSREAVGGGAASPDGVLGEQGEPLLVAVPDRLGCRSRSACRARTLPGTAPTAPRPRRLRP